MTTRTIEISDETWAKIKDQVEKDTQFKEINKFEELVGEKVFIRTVTYHLTGKIKKITGNFFELEDAAWIADSGRFMQCIKDGVLNEVEPIKTKWFVSIPSITDFGIWKHELPVDQK